MSQRIKGQDIEIVLVMGGNPVENFTAAKSIEMTWKTELLQEGYLGETSDRYDSIFKGIGGNIEFHLDTAEVFNIIRYITDKAQRREPGNRVNIKFTANFPNGQSAIIVIPDVEFGPMPLNFGSRSDYGSFKLEFGASIANVVSGS